MNDQLTFAPVSDAEKAGDEGMARALRAQRVRVWKQLAEDWLADQRPGREFIADDLVAVIGLPDAGPARNNVVGAWISAKARQGAVKWTGEFRKSARVIGHGNLLRVWRVT